MIPAPNKTCDCGCSQAFFVDGCGSWPHRASDGGIQKFFATADCLKKWLNENTQDEDTVVSAA